MSTPQPSSPIIEVSANDSPNSGRIKWNASIDFLNKDRTNYVRSDGSSFITQDIDFNHFKGVNLSPGVNDADTATLLQVKQYSTKVFNSNQIYVQPYLGNAIENIYKDGTEALIAIRSGTLDLAVQNIPVDGSPRYNAWTIILDTGNYNLDVSKLNKTVNIEGRGEAVINVYSSLGLSNNVILDSKGIIRNCTIRAYSANTPIALTLYNGIYKDCRIICRSDDTVNNSTIIVQSAVITDSDMIATVIGMDGTAMNGMVDNCRLKTDLQNIENNVDVAINKVISNIDTILGVS